MKKPFDSNFNPSPFDDRNKDDLNEVLRECEAKNKEKEKAIEVMFDILTGKKDAETLFPILVKKSEWPLVFFCFLPPKGHKAVFEASLTRENKNMILSFAYDWLVEYKLIRVEILKEEFVKKFWNDNFEHILI